jgi:hypothetical protein
MGAALWLWLWLRLPLQLRSRHHRLRAMRRARRPQQLLAATTAAHPAHRQAVVLLPLPLPLLQPLLLLQLLPHLL